MKLQLPEEAANEWPVYRFVRPFPTREREGMSSLGRRCKPTQYRFHATGPSIPACASSGDLENQIA